MDQVENSTSQTEDKVEKLCHSVKDYFQKKCDQQVYGHWDNMKRSSLNCEQRGKITIKSTRNILREIIDENNPSLMKEMLSNCNGI